MFLDAKCKSRCSQGACWSAPGGFQAAKELQDTSGQPFGIHFRFILTSLGRLNRLQEAFRRQSSSRGLQELKRLQDGFKTPLETDFDPSAAPRDPKINDFQRPQDSIFGLSPSQLQASGQLASRCYLLPACCLRGGRFRGRSPL